MKVLFRISFLVIAVTFGVLTATAQAEKWTRYATDDDSFSALIPPGALIDAKKGDFGQIFRVYGFAPSVEITLSAQKRPDDAVVLSPPGTKDERRAFKIGDFIITKSDGTVDGRYRGSIAAADKKMSYHLSVSGPSGDDPAIVRALFGLRVNGKPVIAQEKPETEVAGTVVFSKLVTSSEVDEARKRKLVKTKGKVTYEASSKGDWDAPKPSYSRAAVIVERPFPVMDNGPSALSQPTASVLRGYVSYSATVRVTLRADGQIGDMAFIGTDKSVFSERVEQVARKIRFVPAQIDGRNVDSEAILRYAMIGAVYQ